MAYFSQPICGDDRSFFRLYLRPWYPGMGTISEFSRKLARPAGFEPHPRLSHNGTTGPKSQRVGIRCELEHCTPQSRMRKEPIMKRVQFVGLDVHADTIAVAVAEPGGTVRSVGVINRPESIRKLVKQLGSPERVRACYEAGPTGYVIVLAADRAGRAVRWSHPPWCRMTGDRVKTDRRDALKRAEYRAGDRKSGSPTPA